MSTELSTNTTPTRGLALASFDDAFRFAQMVSKSEFAPKDFRGKPESCLLAIQHGSEIGLSPMQALQSIAVINGRPAVWGDAALAVVTASPVCEYVTEGIDGEGEQMAAICVAKRRGYPQARTVRFSVADAKKAGLWGKSGPWTQYPQRMLQLRARGFALRDAFPDVLKGLVTAEEAADYPVPPEPTPAPVSRPPETRLQPMAEPTPIEQARLAVSRAKTLEDLDRLRKRIGERGQDGTFTADQVAELASLCHGKAELLIGAEDAGQEFTHEAAEHEVTAG
jgi:hypothetical protein